MSFQPACRAQHVDGLYRDRTVWQSSAAHVRCAPKLSIRSPPTTRWCRDWRRCGCACSAAVLMTPKRWCRPACHAPSWATHHRPDSEGHRGCRTHPAARRTSGDSVHRKPIVRTSSHSFEVRLDGGNRVRGCQADRSRRGQDRNLSDLLHHTPQPVLVNCEQGVRRLTQLAVGTVAANPRRRVRTT